MHQIRSKNEDTIKDLVALKLRLRQELTDQAGDLTKAVNEGLPSTVIVIQDEVITTANQVVQVENAIGILEEDNA